MRMFLMGLPLAVNPVEQLSFERRLYLRPFKAFNPTPETRKPIPCFRRGAYAALVVADT